MADRTDVVGSARQRRSTLTIVAAMLATLLAAIDSTIVSTALPQIVDDLEGFEHLSLVVTAYLVASTVAIPLYGRLSDLYGRRLLFIIAITTFLLGSLLCGLAQSMGQLIVFRAVQGLGAGGLIPLAQASLGDLYSPRERGRYQGYTLSMWGVAAIAGPLVGGGLTDLVSWRWIFLVNLPVGLVTLVTVIYAIPGATAKRRRSIDYVGAAILAAGVTSLLLALEWGGTTYPWGSGPVVGLLATAGVALVAFLVVERRAIEPIVPLALFANRVFSVSTAANFVSGACMFTVSIYFPIYLQGVLGDSATHSGLVLIGYLAGWVISGTAAGHLIAHTGRYRSVSVFGSSCVLAGLLLATRLQPDTSHWLIAAIAALPGIGMGAAGQGYIVATQNAVAPSQLGVATAALAFFRTIGSSVSVAAFGALLTNRLADEIAGSGRGNGVDRILHGGAASTGLGGGSQEALAAALHPVFVAAAIVAVAGVALALALEDRPLRTGRLPESVSSSA